MPLLPVAVFQAVCSVPHSMNGLAGPFKWQLGGTCMVNAPMLIVPGHELVTSKYISPSFAVAFVAGIMLVTSTDMGHTWQGTCITCEHDRLLLASISSNI